MGIGWRPEIDLTVERLPGVDFVEVVAENLSPTELPESIEVLRRRGTPVIPHAVTLSLAGAEPVDPRRVRHLAELGEALDAPVVSDHIAFVRAGGLDVGHLLPPPRTRDALDVLVSNVNAVQRDLPRPLALENIAALLDWPERELSEEHFLTELVERTDCLLLVDLANLHANAHNIGTTPSTFLDTLPWERLAYAHVAGGVWRDGLYHDTHAHPVPREVLTLVRELAARAPAPPWVMVERDDAYPTDAELADELAGIRAAALAGTATRSPARRADDDR
ncbi:DUF692 domain-containing protein [Actinoalloteichus sp. AHMU CJ021]|nr:DUF692 domain-containing protein [Actinoalloteichus sp. AHMU CJ021]